MPTIEQMEGMWNGGVISPGATRQEYPLRTPGRQCHSRRRLDQARDGRSTPPGSSLDTPPAVNVTLDAASTKPETAASDAAQVVALDTPAVNVTPDDVARAAEAKAKKKAEKKAAKALAAAQATQAALVAAEAMRLTLSKTTTTHYGSLHVRGI